MEWVCPQCFNNAWSMHVDGSLTTSDDTSHELTWGTVNNIADACFSGKTKENYSISALLTPQHVYPASTLYLQCIAYQHYHIKGKVVSIIINWKTNFHLPASLMSVNSMIVIIMYMYWYHLHLPANPTCEPGYKTRLSKKSYFYSAAR